VADELTERVSPSSSDAHHVVNDVVARQTDRLDTTRILDVLGETEQSHVIVGDAAVVFLVHDNLHYVNDLLGPFFLTTVVFAQHHTEI